MRKTVTPGLLLGRRTDVAKQKVYLPQKARQFHLHVLGRFGLGKSKFLEYLIRQDILSNQGLCLIDPHGSLYDAIVTWAAAEGLFERRKIVLFDPAADGWSFGFNPLDFRGYDKDTVSDAVDNMVAACAQAWGGEDTTKTPRLMRILPAVFYALAEQGLTLREAPALLSRGDPLQKVVTDRIKDDVYGDEWRHLLNLPTQEFIEQTESTRNRLSAFMRNPRIRTMVAQREQTIDFRRIMDEGAVVLVNLHGLTTQNQRLVGSLLVNDIASKCSLREPGTSRPFFVYIDECYQFLNEDIEWMITGLRKFGLRLTLAHQNLGQLRQKGSEAIYSAVMQIGNRVVFGGLPYEDLETVAQEMFLGSLDYEEAKHSLDKPTVIGYVRTWLQNHSTTRTEGSSSGTSTADSASVSINEDGEIVVGEGTSSTTSSSTTDSYSTTHGESETLAPVLEERPTQVYSLQEQIHKAMSTMSGQPTRKAIAKLHGRKPRQILTPFLRDTVITEAYVEKKKLETFQLTDFASTRDVAEARITERREKLLQEAKEAVRKMEPKPDEYFE